MRFYIIIPAHNEAQFIGLTLKSLANQTLLPKQVVVVNDHSTDNTQALVESFADKHSWVKLVNISSSEAHLPGAKIVQAFYAGFETVDDNYDVVCKYDADLIFPNNYLETLASHFNNNEKLGMVAGVCYIEKSNNWVLEDLTGKDHIRGALKAYRKACFLEIGKLKKSMGWDTIDELLATYYGWEFFADATLHVKHLKPTGSTYNKTAKHLQGEAMYKMRLGISLTFITALKLAVKKKSLSYFRDYLVGYIKAYFSKPERTVTKAQGKFIRTYRWKGILRKLPFF